MMLVASVKGNPQVNYWSLKLRWRKFERLLMAVQRNKQDKWLNNQASINNWQCTKLFKLVRDLDVTKTSYCNKSITCFAMTFSLKSCRRWHFRAKILFSDEATFHQSVHVNWYIVRFLCSYILRAVTGYAHMWRPQVQFLLSSNYTKIVRDSPHPPARSTVLV